VYQVNDSVGVRDGIHHVVGPTDVTFNDLNLRFNVRDQLARSIELIENAHRSTLGHEGTADVASHETESAEDNDAPAAVTVGIGDGRHA
jgi:hypothetical protein